MMNGCRDEEEAEHTQKKEILGEKHFEQDSMVTAVYVQRT